MKRFPAQFPKLAGYSFLLVLAGCFGLGEGTRQPTRYYTLTPAVESQKENPAGPAMGNRLVGVGPIRLAGYLRRSQIVSRNHENEYQIAGFDRWGEPLEDNFARILATDLGHLLGDGRVTLFPWSSTTPVDFQITARIQRFDRGPDGMVHLVAEWMVLQKDSANPLLVRRSENLQKVEGEDMLETMKAMSLALADFSRELAQAIFRLEEKSSPPTGSS